MHLRGKSVESHIREAVRTIEKSLRDKEYTLRAFLDIERAFNNMTTDLVKRVSEELRVETLITKWVVKMLRSQRNATRGSFTSTIVAYRN